MISATLSPVSRKRSELPRASTTAWIFVENPPRYRPNACFSSPPLLPRHADGHGRQYCQSSEIRCRSRLLQVLPEPVAICRVLPTFGNGYTGSATDRIRTEDPAMTHLSEESRAGHSLSRGYHGTDAPVFRSGGRSFESRSHVASSMSCRLITPYDNRLQDPFFKF